MKIIWSERSRNHLHTLFEYIAENDEIAAQKLVTRIIKLAEVVLCKYPLSGRKGRVLKTRELVITKTPYILAYTIKNDTIMVIAVWHSSREWPNVF